jgi:hypothetical protein
VNDGDEDISSNPTGTILITYFREFPTLPMVVEPPYGRWLARWIISPWRGRDLPGGLGSAGLVWQMSLRILCVISYKIRVSRVSTYCLMVAAKRPYGHDQASITPP